MNEISENVSYLGYVVITQKRDMTEEATLVAAFANKDMAQSFVETLSVISDKYAVIIINRFRND